MLREFPMLDTGHRFGRRSWKRDRDFFRLPRDANPPVPPVFAACSHDERNMNAHGRSGSA